MTVLGAIRDFFSKDDPLWSEPVPRPQGYLSDQVKRQLEAEQRQEEMIRRIIREELPNRMQVLRPEPDDVIVIEYEGDISQETAERIKKHIETIWPDRKALVLGDGLRMKFAGK